MVSAVDDGSGPELGSRADFEPDDRRLEVRPGAMAAWVFRYEDRGARVKR
jgi:hypothetical protein